MADDDDDDTDDDDGDELDKTNVEPIKKSNLVSNLVNTLTKSDSVASHSINGANTVNGVLKKSFPTGNSFFCCCIADLLLIFFSQFFL